MIGRTSQPAIKAAAALMLLGAGGFLVSRGFHEYFGAEVSQQQAARNWIAERSAVLKPVASSVPNQVAPPDAPPAEGAWFSRLEVPRLRKSLYVLEGSNNAALEKGPGHVRGSAMPGENGNCVIAGHRDLHFRFLKDIRLGDQVFLETARGRFCYRVTGTKIISPTQISVLQPTRDAELHLITCYPFYFLGHAPKRYVVTAELQGIPSASPVEANTVSTVSATGVALPVAHAKGRVRLQQHHSDSMRRTAAHRDRFDRS